MPEKIAKNAKAAYKTGKYQKAADQFQKAAAGFSNAGDELMAAEMLNNQSVALLQNGDPTGAFTAASGTDEIFSKARDSRRQAMALGNQAAALDSLGELEEAIEKYKLAAELLKETGDMELRSYVLESLSALQLRTGNQFQSLATMQAALDSKKKLGFKERFLKKILRIPFKLMR